MAYMKVLIAVALIAGVDQALAQWVGTGAGAMAGAGAWPGAGWPANGAAAGAAAGAWPGAGMFGPGFPFNNFPNPWMGGAPLPAVNLPSVADIASNLPSVSDIASSIQPGPNSNFNGMVMTSHQTSETGPDGKPVTTGSTTFLTNQDGKVRGYHIGDDVPNMNSNTQSSHSAWDQIEIPEIKMPEFPKIKMPKFHKMKMPKFHKIKMPKFPEMKMPEFPEMDMPEFPDIEFPEFPDIDMPDIPEIKIPEMSDPEKMKNYAPSEGGNFVSISSITQSHSSDVNGKKKHVGRAEIYINNNGEVHSEVIHFGDEPKRDEKDGERKEKDGENGNDGDEVNKRDEVKEKDEGKKRDEENEVKKVTLGDMDKYEIV